jgi:hypothetical protein
MALTFPRPDIFDLCTISDAPPFWPQRKDEYSPESSGRTTGKKMGSPLWRASFTTAPLDGLTARKLEAALLSLDGVINTFYAHDKTRIWPGAYPGGAGMPSMSPTVASVSGNALLLQDLAVGYQFTAGDVLAFDYGARPNRAYHMILEDVTAPSSITPVTVFPHPRQGWADGDAVTLVRPECEMALEVDGLPAPTLSGMINRKLSFSALQYIF